PYWQMFEFDACMQVRARGYKIMFDFGNVVKHYPTNTAYAGGREGDLQVKIFNSAYNHSLLLAKHSRWYQRPAHWLFQLLVGNVVTPGLLASAVAMYRYGNPKRDLSILGRTVRARLAGAREGARCPGHYDY